MFSFWEKIGLHVTPVHYYEPIPDTRKLEESLWEKKSELVGIDMKEEAQLQLLSDFVSKYKSEYEEFPKIQQSVPHEYYVDNGWFESVDGEMLYCMVRKYKPKKIIEIGSGYSTYLSAQAIQKNISEDTLYSCELVAIEPYPNKVLQNGFPGLSKLISSPVQDIPLTEFETLSDGDILFIDSSHILKIGGDVQYEFLEILPRLKTGVMVHIHDIFLPSEYPKKLILDDHFFYTEQYLLQAFLTFNTSFEIVWAGSCMHLKHPSALEKAFSTYKREQRLPGSFWMRRVSDS